MQDRSTILNKLSNAVVSDDGNLIPPPERRGSIELVYLIERRKFKDHAWPKEWPCRFSAPHKHRPTAIDRTRIKNFNRF